MKSITLIMAVITSLSVTAELVVEEDFESGIFPPPGWVTVAKTLGGGTPSGGWTLSEGIAHGSVMSSINTSWAILYTSPFYLNRGDIVKITFGGRPSGFPPFVELAHDGVFEWSSPIEGSSSVFMTYVFKSPEISKASSDYRVGWEVDQYFPPYPGISYLSIDNVFISVASPPTRSEVETSSLGRIKSTYK